MNATIRDAYLEAQVTTATPQRLRLMLIEMALRRLRAALASWQAGQQEAGIADVRRCREIMTELIGGIQPDGQPLTNRVLGIYLFLFNALVEAEMSQDERRVNEVIGVLEEERQTWQAVCEQMPERPQPAPDRVSTEEIAPQRVTGNWSGDYGGPRAAPVAQASFSIDA